MADKNLSSINKCYFWKKLEETDEFVCLDLKKKAEKGSYQTSYYFPKPGNKISKEDKETIKKCLDELEGTEKLTEELKGNFIIVYLVAGGKDNKETASGWADKVDDITDDGKNTDFVIPIDDNFDKAKAMLEETDKAVSTRKQIKAEKVEKAVEAKNLHYIEYKFSKFVYTSILKSGQFIAFVKHKKKEMGDDVTNVDTYYIYPTFEALSGDRQKRELLEHLKAFKETGKNPMHAIGVSAYGIEHESRWQDKWTDRIERKKFIDMDVEDALELYEN